MNDRLESGNFPATAADRAGLLPGDVVVSVAGQSDNLLETLAAQPRDDPLALTRKPALEKEPAWQS